MSPIRQARVSVLDPCSKWPCHRKWLCPHGIGTGQRRLHQWGFRCKLRCSYVMHGSHMRASIALPASHRWGRVIFLLKLDLCRDCVHHARCRARREGSRSLADSAACDCGGPRVPNLLCRCVQQRALAQGGGLRYKLRGGQRAAQQRRRHPSQSHRPDHSMQLLTFFSTNSHTCQGFGTEPATLNSSMKQLCAHRRAERRWRGVASLRPAIHLSAAGQPTTRSRVRVQAEAAASRLRAQCTAVQ